VTQDRADFLDEFLSLLTDNAVRYCVIDGHAVNAYAEPPVSLDLDVAVATEDLDRIEKLFACRFRIERFPHSVNVSAAGSQLRVQIQTDPRYAAAFLDETRRGTKRQKDLFVPRATPREILGVMLQVAAVEDVLQGKLWSRISDVSSKAIAPSRACST
jgi:hypothetical protein